MKTKSVILPFEQVRSKNCLVIFASFCLVAVIGAFVPTLNARPLPTEYVSTPGLGLGLSNSGVAAFGGIEGIQINPALLSLQSQYMVSAGYYWPGQGRDFYQFGVLDSKTSSIAAAATYTSFAEEFNAEKDLQNNNEEILDAQVRRRMRLGLAQKFSAFAVGISGQMLEAYRPSEDNPFEYETLKGISINLGLAGGVTQELRYGLSVENLSNKKIKEYAPKQYRAGIAYNVNSDVTAHADYKQRERLEIEAEPLPLAQSLTVPRDEKTIITSFTARVYNVVRLLAAYGWELDERRQEMAGGLVIASDKMTISYLTRRPDLKESTSEQTINLSFEMSF
jgi:hypothetical protein